MHAGHKKLRTWGNGGPGELEDLRKCRAGDLGKWRTWVNGIPVEMEGLWS
jgi:hypothetical protein